MSERFPRSMPGEQARIGFASRGGHCASSAAGRCCRRSPCRRLAGHSRFPKSTLGILSQVNSGQAMCYDATNMRNILLALLLVSGCSGAQVKHRADGTYAIECSSQKVCLERAERVCDNQGFTVVGGQNNRKKYGVPGNEKVIGKDELFVRCTKDRPLDTPDPEVGSWRLKEHPEGAPQLAPSASGAASASAPAAQSVPDHHVAAATCRPGETQRCVGAGACEGGQACLADGSGFGPCDCGAPSTDVKAPSEPTGAK
jgi:hypothetical protein